MAWTRIRTLAGLVVAVALLQVFFEDLVVFAGLTDGGGAPDWVFVAVPALLTSLLIVILIGGAIASDDTLR